MMALGKTDKTSATTFKTQTANEWGIPDWRDAAAYGDTRDWTFWRWRWEFYRRRDDLRAAFDASAERTYEFYASQYPPWPDGRMDRVLMPNERGFVARLCASDCEKFGYYSLPNPRISDQHLFHIVANDADNRVSVTFGTMRNTLGSLLDTLNVSLDQKQEFVLTHYRESHILHLQPNEVAITIDLDIPLEAQLRQAQEILRASQIEAHGKKIQKRRHPTKWLAYLRTLDARESGASWREISGLHPNTSQTEQTARDVWEAANALRFNF